MIQIVAEDLKMNLLLILGTGFRQFSDFHGRATRSDYWLWMLSLFIGWAIVIWSTGLAGAASGPFIIIYMLVIALPTISYTVRRLHDSNSSGFWILAFQIPFIGTALWVYFCVRPGTIDLNKYGNPRPRSRITKSSYTTDDIPQEKNSETHEETFDNNEFINISNISLFTIPESLVPNEPEEIGTPDYRFAYYNCEVAYKQGKYQKVKEDLKHLEELGELHSSACSLRLKNYRKLVGKVKSRKTTTETTMALLDEMFSVCAEDITDTDRRTYNQIITKLPKNTSLVVTPKKIIGNKSAIPEFEISCATDQRITLNSQIDIVGRDIKGRGRWSLVGPTQSGFIFAKRIKPESSSRYETTGFTHFNYDKDQTTSWSTDSDARLLSSSKHSDIFATLNRKLLSDIQSSYLDPKWNIDLTIWNVKGEKLCERDISSLNPINISSESYAFRSVQVSADPDRVLVTDIDKAYLLDSNLTKLQMWRVPLKEGWTRETNTIQDTSEQIQIRKDLALFGLNDSATRPDIRRAYRDLILQYHPDRNMGETDYTDKTTEINLAYTRLTGEDIGIALQGLSSESYQFVPDAAKDKPTIIKTEYGDIEISIGITMGGDGRDWIYSSYLNYDGTVIFLGTYAGKVYKIPVSGQSLACYEVRQPVIGIQEISGYIIISSHENLWVFEESNFQCHQPIPKGARVLFGSQGFGLINDKSLVLFAPDGTKYSDISFKSSISDCVWNENKLLVNTTTKCFVFNTF